MTAVDPTSISERVYALIFNGITRASSVATDRHDGWLPLNERERFAEAVYTELAAGNIEFRLGAGRGDALPADEHHYDVSCDDRPDCLIAEHHALEDLP